MGDLISRKSMLKTIDSCKSYAGFPMATKILALELVTYEPSVDAKLVIHGYWTPYSSTMQACSVCDRHTARHRYEYCPHCGSKMDLEVAA